MKLVTRVVTTLAALTLCVSPNAAEASIFDFNGAGIGGGIVWDDAFDASTSNSNCFDGNDCFTSTFSELLSPLTIVVTGAGADLTFTDLFLLFSFPSGSVDCSSFTYCGTLTDLGTLLPVLGPTAFDGLDLTEVGPSETVPIGSRQIIAVDVLNGPVLIASLAGGVITPPANFLTGLPLALLPDARVGLAAHFVRQLEIDPFTVSIPRAAAAPEPASLLLVGLGLTGAVASRCRRRSKTARS